VLATLFFLLFAVPSAYASTTAQSTPATHPVAATHPSASCPQPNRNQAISTLTLQERLDQGYPLPVNGKTDPNVDQIVHDKGVHFCADTDVPRTLKTSIGHSESNSRWWSGNYADGGYSYTYVQLFWNESCIAYGTNDHYSTWAGIGGINSNNLVQAGADGNNWDAFTHNYDAWIENTASGYEATLFSINCGDAIFVEIASGNCMYLVDETSGKNSGWRCTGPNADSSMAECIVEAPTINGSVANLSNYGTETLSSCQIEIGGASTNYGIGNVPHDYYNMYNGSRLLSSTGPISNGDTYTMTWHNYS
jgi:hypothetical protein